MLGLRLYLTLGILGAVLAGGFYVRHVIGQNAALRAEVAALENEARVQAEIAAQAALARDVARAEAKRQAEKAAETAAIREWINGRDDNAPIPDLLRDALDRLMRRSAR